MDEIIVCVPNENSELIFNTNDCAWAFKITSKGIIFNREKYPQADPYDFASCFMDILENLYEVKFEKIKNKRDFVHQTVHPILNNTVFLTIIKEDFYFIETA